MDFDGQENQHKSEKTIHGGTLLFICTVWEHIVDCVCGGGLVGGGGGVVFG